MKLVKTLGLTALLAGSAFATTASAATVNFAADGGTWNAGTSSITSGDLTVTSIPDVITWENDGLGVQGGNESDEIDFGESLTLTFANAVTVTSISLDDLWVETNGGSADVANVLVNGSTLLSLTGSKFVNANPDATVFDVNLGSVTEMVFTAMNGGSASNVASDYALSAISYTPSAVPLPAGFWLLGSAMVFLLRKRQAS